MQIKFKLVNVSIPKKKLTTQSIYFSKNFQMVASDPYKFHSVKVSVFKKKQKNGQCNAFEKVAAYRRFRGNEQ